MLHDGKTSITASQPLLRAKITLAKLKHCVLGVGFLSLD